MSPPREKDARRDAKGRLTPLGCWDACLLADGYEFKDGELWLRQGEVWASYGPYQTEYEEDCVAEAFEAFCK